MDQPPQQARPSLLPYHDSPMPGWGDHEGAVHLPPFMETLPIGLYHPSRSLHRNDSGHHLEHRLRLNT